MSAAAPALQLDRYGSRPRPAMKRAAALSAVVHVCLVAVLFFGVRFQSNPPETVTVELWEAPPPPPPPAVEEKPPPPKPVPQPEPEPQVKKPDIALVEKPKSKPKPEPKRDLAFEKKLREEAALEERKIEEQRKERELRQLIARQQAAARDKALLTWTDKIRAKIRGNIVLPRDIPGNPEAIFDVTLLPTGEVLTVRRRQSSGHAAYDDAVERAIMKSSPLPQPDDRAVFRRDLELKFRPQDR
ncbi:MAG TPA: energy transducer TonB [Burkholderiales bacterium]|nr:energy transducer TonB [Burkholderiales bacterium]